MDPHRIPGYSGAADRYDNASESHYTHVKCSDCDGSGRVPCEDAPCGCPCQDSPEIAQFHAPHVKSLIKSGDCCTHDCPKCKGEGEVAA